MLNLNTVKITKVDGEWRFDVLDSLGRWQDQFRTIEEADAYANTICRYGWPLELDGHATAGSDCLPEHLTFEARSELAALSVEVA
jgi:hypothetical protein